MKLLINMYIIWIIQFILILIMKKKEKQKEKKNIL